MSEGRPPAFAERLLHRALGKGEAASTILGDLREDFARLERARGRPRATLWYWREALTLSAGSFFNRFSRPAGVESRKGEGTMSRVSSRIGIVEDAKYALRAVRRDRDFGVAAALVIGLGVGATTAVFSVMRPLLLQPLPFPDAERLVVIDNDAGEGMSGITSRTSNLRDLSERVRSFEGLAGYNAFFAQGSYNLRGVGEPERLIGAGITHDFLDVLGVTLAHGRDFEEQEGLWEGPPAVILTHGFWARRFGSERSVVGTSITLNDRPYQVVGVLPTTFDFSSLFAPSTPVDILVPWAVSDETDGQGNTTTIIGRLRAGATVGAAQEEIDAVMTDLRSEDPRRWGLGGTASPLQERIARPFRAGMLLLGAAAGLVMLIVCVNLSNMLLARSPRRRREMAVRRAFGATSGRLVRQLLLESLAISAGGAVIGVAIAASATGFVRRTRGLDIPLLDSVGVDAVALAFTLAIAVVAGLAVGIVPALQVAEWGGAGALSGSARGASAGRAARRLREILVVSEVAMACVLLVFGGLVLRSFQRVMEVELGFEPEGSVAWQLSTSRGFDTLPELVAYYDRIVRAVEAVPGVEGAGLVDAIPLGRNRSWGARVVGETYAEGERPGFFPHVIDRRYLDVMRVPLLEGRHFTADDTRDSPWVVMVNETAARTMFPGGRALGRSLDMWYGEAEVVGVVGDVKHRGLEELADREVYFPMSQVWDFSTLDLVVRSPLPAEALTGAVATAIRTVDPQLPTEDVRTLTSVVDGAVSSRRFTMQLLGAFAGGALLLAALGIYGVLSYSVTERVPEIGIRMALGESAADVRRGVVARTLVLAGIGVATGVAASLLGARVIGSLLFGVEPTDPVTFVSIVGLLLLVATLAGLIPAVRASRIDSADALRSAT